MLKTTTHGSVQFHAEVKAYRPPVIVDSFTDDSGELQYVLANGTTTPAHRYNALWNPPKSNPVFDKKYKGQNPDTTKI